MISNTDIALISALDLNPIKKKLMHVESGEGWSLEHATAVETEYRRFLYLMKAFPGKQIAPLVDVDTFWHYHILDTMKYARDCQEVFGYFLHHYPYLGMDDENDIEERHGSGDRTRELDESSFGVSYARATAGQGTHASQEAAGAQVAWCIGIGEKASGAQTAWCIGIGEKAAGAQTAWCIGTGTGIAAETAIARATHCIGAPQAA